jgi:hypothetical protein
VRRSGAQALGNAGARCDVLSTMSRTTAYGFHRAGAADDPTLAWLSALAGQPRLARPALVGHVDGMPAAAISLVDGRVVADPFRPTADLVAQLRLRRSGWRSTAGTTPVAARLRGAITFRVAPASSA